MVMTVHRGNVLVRGLVTSKRPSRYGAMRGAIETAREGAWGAQRRALS